eukprot:5493770-Pleurochrysis_carterae.AAC.1
MRLCRRDPLCRVRAARPVRPPASPWRQRLPSSNCVPLSSPPAPPRRCALRWLPSPRSLRRATTPAAVSPLRPPLPPRRRSSPP